MFAGRHDSHQDSYETDLRYSGELQSGKFLSQNMILLRIHARVLECFLSCIIQKETDCVWITRHLWKRFQEHRKCQAFAEIEKPQLQHISSWLQGRWGRRSGCHLPCCNSAAIFLLQGTIINDALMTFFCGLCETCRMAREVRIRNGEV